MPLGRFALDFFASKKNQISNQESESLPEHLVEDTVKQDVNECKFDVRSSDSPQVSAKTSFREADLRQQSPGGLTNDALETAKRPHLGELDDEEPAKKKIKAQEGEQSVLYNRLSQDFESFCGNNALPVLAADDSDEESIPDREENVEVPHLGHRDPPSSTTMTVESSYHGKIIRFKGNQLIIWARDMMERVISTPNRKSKIDLAVNNHTAVIRRSDDWLDYEGMFDNFSNMAAKPSPPFNGILTVFLNDSVSTTVEFKNKINRKLLNGKWITEPSNMLYAHLHDQSLIHFLKDSLRLKKYHYADNLGVSYSDIVHIIDKSKQFFQITDALVAQRQLMLFKCVADGEITALDQFLAFFNAILFGSETSRNSTSFVTGLLTLQIIADGKMTYKEGFNSPSYELIKSGTTRSFAYAVYPMASPYTGPGNIKGYKRLLELSKEEEKSQDLSSSIGMKASRERAQWAQIQLKEAILLKYWSDVSIQDATPQWLNASSISADRLGHAVEFARQFNQGIVLFLRRYFSTIPRWLVYSRDEIDALSSWKYSRKIWKDSSDPESTVTVFKALEWHLTTTEPLKFEKCLHDAEADLASEIMASLADSPEEHEPIDDSLHSGSSYQDHSSTFSGFPESSNSSNSYTAIALQSSSRNIFFPPTNDESGVGEQENPGLS